MKKIELYLVKAITDAKAGDTLIVDLEGEVCYRQAYRKVETAITTKPLQVASPAQNHAPTRKISNKRTKAIVMQDRERVLELIGRLGPVKLSMLQYRLHGSRQSQYHRMWVADDCRALIRQGLIERTQDSEVTFREVAKKVAPMPGTV